MNGSSALLVLALGLFTLGCADTVTGECNSCPGWRAVDTSECEVIAAEAGCASGVVVEVEDDSCGLGMPPMTHLVCQFTDCAEEVSCERFAVP
jgi:hypothetical protein